MRSIMPKLFIIPANEAFDDDLLMENRQNLNRKALSLSPSPSPKDLIDPEIDPDNVVIRGTYDTDEDSDDDN